jgi:hypothetical protein
MNDDNRDDEKDETPAAPEGSGRRSEPHPPTPQLHGDVPAACRAAAAHVANCDRCFAALRAHLDETILALLGADGRRSH